MKNRKAVDEIVDQLNLKLHGIKPGEAGIKTPGALFITSYKPGDFRFYSIERNTADAESSGVHSLYTGSLKEVRLVLEGMLYGVQAGSDTTTIQSRL